jgi:hypothetical protein
MSSIIVVASANQKVAFMHVTVLCLNYPVLYRAAMTAIDRLDG